MHSSKFALIHFGTHEIYGLCFVASELNKCGHHFRWFDGEHKDVIDEILDWGPNFLCFSPLSTFYDANVLLARKIKSRLPSVRSIFGGLHVLMIPEAAVMLDEIDVVVVGPVYDTIDDIINSKTSTIIKGKAITPKNLKPMKREYYEEIPRIGNRHVKMIMTHFGCAYNCAYCSVPHIRNEFGAKNFKKYWLTRRSIKDVIDEAKIFLEYPTAEVELSDDDMLFGADIDTWLPDFCTAWQSEIDLPIFGNITPVSILRVPDKTLAKLADLVCNVCIGLQAVEKATLKLFNRQYQTKEIFKKAIKRLIEFDIPVKIDLIVGNPVKDPITDAIETIKFAQSVSSDKIITTVFPLMLYPGTKLTKWCIQNNIKLNDECKFNWYNGVGSVKFDFDTAKKIRNLVKLGNFFVTHNIGEKWIRALIETDIDENAARCIAECNYYDSLVHHGRNEKDIKKIMNGIKLYY